MNTLLRYSILLLLTLIPTAVLAQQPSRPSVPANVRSTSAYAEVLLRATEVRSELDSIADDHTDASTRVIDLKTELEALEKAIDRLAMVRPTDTGKLTLALGKMLVRKSELDTDLARMLRSYKPEHPDVRRAMKKTATFEKAISEILP